MNIKKTCFNAKCRLARLGQRQFVADSTYDIFQSKFMRGWEADGVAISSMLRCVGDWVDGDCKPETGAGCNIREVACR